MSRRSAWFIAAFVLLLLAGALGLWNGPREWGGAANHSQRLAAFIETGYGISGLVSAAALWFGHPKTMVPVWVWALLITLTGGLAPVVWGAAPVKIGLWSALASGIVALLVTWLASRALRAALRRA